MKDRLYVVLVATFLVLVYLHVPVSQEAPRATITEPDWESVWRDVIPAKDKLDWNDCYEGFQCTRFKVPLNYSCPQSSSLVLALIQYPSPHAHNDSLYLGPILFNPGGPGGSGVDFVQMKGKVFSALFDGRYDIVGFDPRGVARSTRVTAFISAVERALFGFTLLRDLGWRPDGPAHALANSVLIGELAVERDEGILAHITTDHTARDMLRITEAYGFEKLQYWGFSYGTVLGATFAAMFPDKVGRVLIDGVVDSENYYSTMWSNNLADSSDTLQGFFDACHAAGPSSCAFYAPSPSLISANLTSLYERLRHAPVSFKSESGYGIVDYAMLRLAVFRALYSPYNTYQPLAEALSALASGRGENIANMVLEPAITCSSDPDDLESKPESSFAILCNDGAHVPNNLSAVIHHYDKMSSKYEFGSLWASLRIGCAGWPKWRKTHFQGPFVTDTAHPIFLIGNTADPVTPLRSARKMSEGFAGSVVLHQDSLGHCSLSAASPCSLAYVRAYFFNGTLPAIGTICPIVDELFPKDNVKSELFQQVYTDDVFLTDIAMALRPKTITGPLGIRF